MECAIFKGTSVPDYSNFHYPCDHCGKILSEVKDTQPRSCSVCGLSHYCSVACLVTEFKTRHRPECMARLDAENEMPVLSSSQALWDLRKYTMRWHDQLGYAAVAALNLHSDPTAIDRQALVVYLSYVPRLWRRMQRFRFQRARVEPLATLSGPSMEAAKIRQREYTVINRENGMVGAALIVLACDVPEVGLVFNSTYVGPEPDLLMEPPPPDWQERFMAVVRVNELPQQ